MHSGTRGHSSLLHNKLFPYLLSEPLLWARAGAQVVEQLWNIQEPLDPILATLPWGMECALLISVPSRWRQEDRDFKVILHYAASLRSDSQKTKTTTTKDLSLVVCHPGSWGSWGRRIEVQGLSGLQSECKANMGSLVMPCPQRKSEKRARSLMGQSLRWKESGSTL